jgi:hypothetical protein
VSVDMCQLCCWYVYPITQHSRMAALRLLERRVQRLLNMSLEGMEGHTQQSVDWLETLRSSDGVSSMFFLFLGSWSAEHCRLFYATSTCILNSIADSNATLATDNLQFNSDLGERVAKIHDILKDAYRPETTGQPVSRKQYPRFVIGLRFLHVVGRSLIDADFADDAFRDAEDIRDPVYIKHFFPHEIISNMKAAGLF